MGKKNIDIEYQIYDPQPLYYPKDKINGQVSLTSKELEKIKLKKFEATLCEDWYHWEYRGSRDEGSRKEWVFKSKTCSRVIFCKARFIEPNETIAYEFEMFMPKKWKPRMGRKFKSWQFNISFFHKTRLKKRYAAKHILPVEGGVHG